MNALERHDVWRDVSVPTVLVVTSCPWTGRAIESAVSDAGFVPLRAGDVDSASRLCTAGAIDALILDERAAGFGTSDGAAAHALIESVQAGGVVPVVLLAHDRTTSEQWTFALGTGVWAIVPFPLGAPWWVQQLGVWVRAARDSRRQVDLGLVDVATGLYNRRGLLRRAAEIEGAVRRNSGRLACAVFDVQVSDGSRALRIPAVGDGSWNDAIADAVAEACRRLGRAGDAFARTGSTDFAIVAPDASAAGVRALVERIGAAVGDRLGTAPVVRIGTCDVGDASLAMLSSSDMLVHAASARG